MTQRTLEDDFAIKCCEIVARKFEACGYELHSVEIIVRRADQRKIAAGVAIRGGGNSRQQPKESEPHERV